MHDWDSGWWIVMMLAMLVFWALVIVGVVWLVRELAGGRRDNQAGEQPLDILARRLAHGEISVAEYEERRETLRRSPPG